MHTLSKALGLWCVLASGALAFASACGSDDDDGVAVAPDGGSDATTVLADGAVSSGLADGQIYQALLTFNQGRSSRPPRRARRRRPWRCATWPSNSTATTRTSTPSSSSSPG